MKKLRDILIPYFVAGIICGSVCGLVYIATAMKGDTGDTEEKTNIEEIVVDSTLGFKYMD